MLVLNVVSVLSRGLMRGKFYLYNLMRFMVLVALSIKLLIVDRELICKEMLNSLILMNNIEGLSIEWLNIISRNYRMLAYTVFSILLMIMWSVSV